MWRGFCRDGFGISKAHARPSVPLFASDLGLRYKLSATILGPYMPARCHDGHGCMPSVYCFRLGRGVSAQQQSSSLESYSEKFRIITHVAFLAAQVAEAEFES